MEEDTDTTLHLHLHVLPELRVPEWKGMAEVGENWLSRLCPGHESIPGLPVPLH